jgi:hypothetical protein
VDLADVLKAYDAGCERRGKKAEWSPEGLTALGWAGPGAAFAWVLCEDGYLRRAPDESVDVVNGLHRSLLAALGNSIVPELAYRIISEMKPFL